MNFCDTLKYRGIKRSSDISRTYWQLLLDGQRLHVTFHGDVKLIAYPRLITTDANSSGQRSRLPTGRPNETSRDDSISRTQTHADSYP